MASKSSINSSTSHHQDENEQNHQLPNSDLNKSIEFENLSKDNLIRGSEVQEHNFFGPVQVGSSSFSPNHKKGGKDENKNEKKNSDPKYYSCNYCKGQYSSLQALGGHQNAHKAERALQKQQINERYEGDAFNLGQPYFNRYLNYPIAAPYTPYNYRPVRPLGVRIESMIHKSPISPRFGHGAFRLHDILHPSLVSGVANLGIGGASTSRTGANLGIGGASTSGIGAMLNIGESSTNNVATNMEEEPSDSDSSGLDLSLKL